MSPLAHHELCDVDAGKRIEVDLTAFLTAVAFKMLVSSMLPPVSYLTYIDIYIMSCFAFLIGLTILHTTIPTMFQDHHVEHADQVACYFAACMWGGYHSLLLVWVTCFEAKIHHQEFEF